MRVLRRILIGLAVILALSLGWVAISKAHAAEGKEALTDYDIEMLFHEMACKIDAPPKENEGACKDVYDVLEDKREDKRSVREMLKDAQRTFLRGEGYAGHARKKFRVAADTADILLDRLEVVAKDERSWVRKHYKYYHGNLLMYRSVASLRILEGETLVWRDITYFASKLEDIIRAYEDALTANYTEGMYEYYEARCRARDEGADTATVKRCAADDVDASGDTIRKNLLLAREMKEEEEKNKEQKAKQTPQEAAQPPQPRQSGEPTEDEKRKAKIVEQVLGDPDEGEGSESRVLLPAPPKEGLPQEGYTPGDKLDAQ